MVLNVNLYHIKMQQTFPQSLCARGTFCSAEGISFFEYFLFPFNFSEMYMEIKNKELFD